MTGVATVSRFAVAIIMMLFLRRRCRDGDGLEKNVYCSFFIILRSRLLFFSSTYDDDTRFFYIIITLACLINRYLSTEDGRLRLRQLQRHGGSWMCGMWKSSVECRGGPVKKYSRLKCRVIHMSWAFSWYGIFIADKSSLSILLKQLSKISVTNMT
jgi:hypothetical protein